MGSSRCRHCNAGFRRMARRTRRAWSISKRSPPTQRSTPAKTVETISLGGSPEFAAVDSAAGRVYCNIEDKSEVEVIDAAKREVIGRWPLAPGEEPTGIALDVAHHRLFATCHNKLLAMLDT